MIVERYSAKGMAFALRMTGRRADAEDVLQDAFTRLWQAAPRFDAGRASLSTWFHRILANACIDRHRRHRPETDLDAAAEIADPAESALDRAVARQSRAAVAAALEELPERQRAAVVMCHYQGLSNIEAAAALEVTVHALEALLVRGRRRLRALLAERMGAEGGR